jgi:hypothetical protein
MSNNNHWIMLRGTEVELKLNGRHDPTSMLL